MIGNFARLVVEGYLSPRTSMRRMLDGGHGIDVSILLIILAFLIGAILSLLFGGLGHSGHLAAHIVNLLSSVILIAAFTFFIHRIGRAFGGTAELSEIFLVVSWHGVVTSFLTPLGLGLTRSMGQVASQPVPGQGAAELVVPQISQSVLLGGIIYTALTVWLLANYIAEAHKFQNTWGVLGVLIGVPMLLTFIVVSLAGAAPV